MQRICLGFNGESCGELTQRSRCPLHQSRYEAARPPRRAKGRYDWKHTKLAKLTKRQQPWCSSCHAPDTPANPLQADHIVPLEMGGKNVKSNYQTLCRACNAAKRDRLASIG